MRSSRIYHNACTDNTSAVAGHARPHRSFESFWVESVPCLPCPWLALTDNLGEGEGETYMTHITPVKKSLPNLEFSASKGAMSSKSSSLKRQQHTCQPGLSVKGKSTGKGRDIFDIASVPGLPHYAILNRGNLPRFKMFHPRKIKSRYRVMGEAWDRG